MHVLFPPRCFGSCMANLYVSATCHQFNGHSHFLEGLLSRTTLHQPPAHLRGSERGFMYSTIRSTLVILLSTSTVCRVHHWSVHVSLQQLGEGQGQESRHLRRPVAVQWTVTICGAACFEQEHYGCITSHLADGLPHVSK